ncbi:MAG: winged helix-turn-helix transcriptional regulator [Dehalococcoidia bacterium]
MQATRQEILDYLHREGRGTVRDLSRLLGLTFTGVRQHLTVLERDGMVQAREERGRVGRPAFVYTLTEKGEALFPKNYDTLANLLIEELRAAAGADALQRVLRRISARMAEQRLDRVEGRPIGERVTETAQIMREMGCVADCEQKGDEFLLYQSTCPYPNVARRNSGVCALEVDLVRRLTGADARLVTSLLRGDRACTYRIRPTTAAIPTTNGAAPRAYEAGRPAGR